MSQASSTQERFRPCVGNVIAMTDPSPAAAEAAAIREDDRLLDVLHRINSILALDSNLETVLQSITEEARLLTRAQFAAFFFRREANEGRTLELVAVAGVPKAVFTKFGDPRKTPVFAPTMREHRILRSADITQEPFYGQIGPHHGMPPGHPPVRAYLAVPVLSRRGDAYGTMMFGHMHRDVFDERCERMAAAIAGQAALAIDNSSLYADSLSMETALRRMNEGLEERIVERTRALAESEARYRRMIEDAPAPVHSLDRNGRVLMVSRRWLSFFGYDEDQVIGQPIRRFMTARGRQVMDQHWPSFLASTEVMDIETEMLRAGGTPAQVLISARVFRDQRSQFVRSMGVVTDLTQRQRTEAALRQSHKLQAVGQLAAGVGHDFNNAAMAAKGGLTIFLKRYGDGLCEQARLLLLQVSDRIALGGHTAHRLLSFARQDALKAVEIHPAQLMEDLSGGADQAKGLLVGTMGKAAVTLVCVPPAPDTPTFEADRSQLLTVLINMAINARDAMMPKGGTLTVSIAGEVVKEGVVDDLRGGEYVRIDISDTGSGMTDEVLARCTEPFFTTKAPGDGTGLGLPMAHGFAEQSGGALRIVSTVGLGTTISLFFPVTPKRGQA